jgi:hypothetical protein
MGTRGVGGCMRCHTIRNLWLGNSPHMIHVNSANSYSCRHAPIGQLMDQDIALSFARLAANCTSCGVIGSVFVSRFGMVAWKPNRSLLNNYDGIGGFRVPKRKRLGIRDCRRRHPGNRRNRHIIIATEFTCLSVHRRGTAGAMCSND